MLQRGLWARTATRWEQKVLFSAPAWERPPKFVHFLIYKFMIWYGIILCFIKNLFLNSSVTQTTENFSSIQLFDTILKRLLWRILFMVYFECILFQDLCSCKLYNDCYQFLNGYLVIHTRPYANKKCLQSVINYWLRVEWNFNKLLYKGEFMNSRDQKYCGDWKFCH